MPLAQQRPDWVGRIVVTIIVATVASLPAIVGRAGVLINAPDLVVNLVAGLWAFTFFLTLIWALGVWAPNVGKWVRDQLIRAPWSF